MGTKRKIYLPSIANLGASSAAGTVGLVDLPLYYDYHAIGLEYLDGGATPQHIIYSSTGALYTGSTAGGLLGDIALKINTDTVRIHSAAQLDRLNSLNGTIYAAQQVGAAAATTVQTLKMYFAEPWRKDKNDTLATVATLTPAFGVNSAQLQITLASAMPATGALRVFAIVDAPKQTPPANGQLVKKVLRQQLAASGTSLDVTNLDRKGYYQTIVLTHPSTGFITAATVKVNGTVIRELDRRTNVAELTAAGMNPSNSVTVSTFGFELVLDDDDPLNSALPVQGQDLQLKLDFSAAAAGNVVANIERLEFGW